MPTFEEFKDHLQAPEGRRDLAAGAAVVAAGAVALMLGLAWMVQPVTPKTGVAAVADGMTIVDGPPTNVPGAPPPPLKRERIPTTPDAVATADAAPFEVADKAEDSGASDSTGDEPSAAKPDPSVKPLAAVPAMDRTTPASGCASAANAADRMLCASPRLASADAHLHRLYRRALDESDDPDSLREDQRRWLDARDRAVQHQDVEALNDLYQARIEELSEPE